VPQLAKDYAPQFSGKVCQICGESLPASAHGNRRTCGAARCIMALQNRHRLTSVRR